MDSSLLKDFADDNFKFDENGRKFSKKGENTVGKLEIARYKQFLLFPPCFFKRFLLQTYIKTTKLVRKQNGIIIVPNDKVLALSILKKKSCVSTGVRKPGNTCASPTAMT